MLKRLILDAVMTALVLAAFAYQMTGNTVHELIGFVILAFFLVHNIALNWRWFASLTRGRYNGRRTVSLVVNMTILAISLTLLISGLANSRLIGGLLGIEKDLLPREIHTTAAYWFLVLMAVHIGMHWKMIMAEARKQLGITGHSGYRVALLRVSAFFISLYGLHAAVERNIYAKLIAYFSFDFWRAEGYLDYVIYFAQYVSIIGLGVTIAHYSLRYFSKRG